MLVEPDTTAHRIDASPPAPLEDRLLRIEDLVVEFHAAPGRVDDMKAALLELTVATRASPERARRSDCVALPFERASVTDGEDDAHDLLDGDRIVGDENRLGHREASKMIKKVTGRELRSAPWEVSRKHAL